MRAFFFFALLVCGGLTAVGQQFPSEKFHTGSVTLNDGTELQGRIKYDLTADVILVIETGKSNVTTLSANQFQFFSIDAGKGKAMRSFYSVPVVNQTGYRRPKIFELIHQGGVSLIAREYIATRSRSSSNRSSFRRSIYDPFYGPGNQIVTFRYLAYELWLIDENANLTEVGNTKNDVIRAFPDQHSELRKFIKRERLRVDKLVDLTKVVAHYNELKNL